MAATLTTKFKEDEANEMAEPRAEEESERNVFSEYLRARIAAKAENRSER